MPGKPCSSKEKLSHNLTVQLSLGNKIVQCAHFACGVHKVKRFMLTRLMFALEGSMVPPWMEEHGPLGTACPGSLMVPVSCPQEPVRLCS